MSYQITQYHFPPRQLYLNSKYATLTKDDSKNSHCWFSLVDTVIIPKDYDNLLIEVQDAQIPISFFTVNTTNNTFSATYDLGTFIDVVIPVGNYDAISLAITAQSQINLAFGSACQIQITYNEISNKFIFTKSSGTASSFTLKFPIYASTLWGFASDSTNNSVNNVIKSPFGVDLAGSRFLFIQCPSFNTTNINSKTGTTNQIIAKVPITQDYLQIEQYMSKGFTIKSHNSKSISVVEIIIVDDNMNEIDFNGVDWSLTMNITILGQPLEALVNSGASPQIVGN